MADQESQCAAADDLRAGARACDDDPAQVRTWRKEDDMTVEVVVLGALLAPDYEKAALADLDKYSMGKESILKGVAPMREARKMLESTPGVHITYAPYGDTDLERGARRDSLIYRQPPPTKPIEQSVLDALKNAEVVLGVDLPVDLIGLAPNLKWVHTFSAGIDQAYGSGLEKSDKVLFTNQGPLMSRGIAEQCLAGILALSKRFDHFQTVRARREWLRNETIIIKGKTLGIYGLGGIGGHLAQMAKCLGMRVIGTKRNTGKPVENVDQLFPPERRIEVAAQSDFLALCSALTPDTLKMLGEKEIAAMKPTAFVVNVGRGKLIDEPFLIKALKEKRLAGAHLDCFWTEPNPPENELWDMPNVIFSPHNSGTQEGIFAENVKVFHDNLLRYLKKEPLLYLKPPRELGQWY
jgi:phosphoglycerate dehydrogenase-like enzyme